LEAQVRTEEELIRRFRAETGDPDALRDQETLSRVETAQAITDLGLAPAAGQGPTPAPPERAEHGVVHPRPRCVPGSDFTLLEIPIY
jgi:hypothetical protein